MSSSRPQSEGIPLNLLKNWSDIDPKDDVELSFVSFLRETLSVLPDDELLDCRLEEIFYSTTEDNVAATEDASTDYDVGSAYTYVTIIHM